MRDWIQMIMVCQSALLRDMPMMQDRIYQIERNTSRLWALLDLHTELHRVPNPCQNQAPPRGGRQHPPGAPQHQHQRAP
eukprot:10773234-Ditylum_brightwellii.AAC.1